MKIAILGGTFNPVHTGHVLLARSVCDTFGYDKILFVPSFMPPHKIVTESVSVEDRLNMLALACEEDSRFEVEKCEIERGGISYTWDTVCYIEEKYSAVLEGKLGLIIGQDLSAEFSKWKNAGQLAEKTDLILSHRPNEDNVFEAEVQKDGFSSFENKHRGDFSGEFATEEMLKEFPYPHRILYNPLFKVSSTDIRALAAAGKDFSGLVPEKVYCYIRNRKLYGYRF